MMTSNQLGDANELARRFVACKKWRWMPGMLTTDKSRLLSGAIGRDEDDGDVFEFSNRGNGVVGSLHEFEMPDLSDAATRGCILQLVREAWGDQFVHCQFIATELGEPECWMAFVDRLQEYRQFEGDTEAEALLAALEAAP